MIIGITGLISSGKDTIASFIKEELPFYKEKSFAYNLKKVISTLYDWDLNLLLGKNEVSRKWRETKNEELSSYFGYDITPRNQCQLIGDGLKAIINDKLWVYLLEKEIKDEDNIIITDVRFPYEFDMIKSLGGIIIKVIREPLPKWYNYCDNYNKNKNIFNYLKALYYINKYKIHDSEYLSALNGYADIIIYNNGTKEDLKNDIKNLIKKGYIK